MKNLQQGFVGLAIAIIIGLVLVGGGTYVYLNKVHEQNGNNLSTTSNTSSIIDLKDVKDFDTCMSYAKNIPTVFDIVFMHGSDIQEVRNFEADLKTAYPRAKLTISSEQDYLNEAVAANRISIKTQSAMDEYKKGIIAQADSKISVTVPINDLGSLQNFSNFISATLNKYAHIKFKQYAGSSPETTLSSGTYQEQMQKYAEKQCDYKYKKLSASDRSSDDIKATNQSIQPATTHQTSNSTSQTTSQSNISGWKTYAYNLATTGDVSIQYPGSLKVIEQLDKSSENRNVQFISTVKNFIAIENWGLTIWPGTKEATTETTTAYIKSYVNQMLNSPKIPSLPGTEEPVKTQTTNNIIINGIPAQEFIFTNNSANIMRTRVKIILQDGPNMYMIDGGYPTHDSLMNENAFKLFYSSFKISK